MRSIELRKQRAGRWSRREFLVGLTLGGSAGLLGLRRGVGAGAVTASAMTHDRQRILAAGFDGYQTKPISVKEFVEVVRQVLDRSRGSGAPS